jgi:hypothetical protein
MLHHNKNNIKKNSKYAIIDFPEDGKLFGTIYAKTPKTAGEKAFTKLLKYTSDINFENTDNDDDFLGKFLVYVIKNLDSNNEHKFIATRIKLAKEVNNKYQYKNIVGYYNNRLDEI